MRKEGGFESSVVGPIPIFIPQEDDLLSFINIRLMELPLKHKVSLCQKIKDSTECI